MKCADMKHTTDGREFRIDSDWDIELTVIGHDGMESQTWLTERDLEEMLAEIKEQRGAI